MTRGYRVAVVGATGVVGTAMLELLRERSFPASEIVPFATERSAGRQLDGDLVSRRQLYRAWAQARAEMFQATSCRPLFRYRRVPG